MRYKRSVEAKNFWTFFVSLLTTLPYNIFVPRAVQKLSVIKQVGL